MAESKTDSTAESLDDLRARAESGDSEAQYNLLGVAYADGVGVPQDDAEAARWYRKAAEQGNVFAQTNLGCMYKTGRGVVQDYGAAVRWTRLAAEQGHAVAQYSLAVMYAEGSGVPQDDVQAHMWFNLAVSRMTREVREDAVRNRDRLADLMTPDDRSEAQRLAREWDATHPRD